MKVKDRVYYYTIKLDFMKDKVIQGVEESKVLGVNSSKLVLDDSDFTVIKYKKLYRSDNEKLFNEVGVFDSHFSTFTDYIFGYLHTSSSSKKIAYKRIKKALEKFIYEKHGRYCNAITMLDKIET
jgi:hypothetical protein